MLRAVDVTKHAPKALRFADVVVLDYEARRRRRMRLTAKGGLSFLLDLAAAPRLEDGDALVLDDGRLIFVEAAPEPLMELTCADPRHLARLAWHIGNRHLPAQILEGAIRIRADHVIGDMARGLGATVVSLSAPFEPEKGAYQGPGHEH